MERDFLLLHGLPGSGKTSLCRCLAEQNNFFFANIGAAPDFRKTPMSQICVRLYLESGARRPLITEGVLSARESRDKFVSNVLDSIYCLSNVILKRPMIIFLDEQNTHLLIKRRKRPIEEYKLWMKEIILGSKEFDYATYTCGNETIDERCKQILALFEK